MADPYIILGVNRTDSDDDIKKAYRDLARKYHPDNYRDNPLADLAGEKMKEINSAYDEIQKSRAHRSAEGSGSSFYDFNEEFGSAGYSGTSDFARIRTMIQAGRFSEAEILINDIREENRNAEWHFLNGILCYKRGWYYEAQQNFQTACKLDPSNTEYRAALNMQKQNTQSYQHRSGRGYRTNQGGCSTCDICTGLLCADCCCECCGGDLISCC